jgi:hypothetical protein
MLPSSLHRAHGSGKPAVTFVALDEKRFRQNAGRMFSHCPFYEGFGIRT